VGFDSDLTIRREIDRVLHLHRIEVQLVMEFDNIETIKRAIEIDAGVSLLPEPTVLREVAAGTLVAVPLDTDELVRPLGIIHRRGKQLSATTWRFVELLKREGDRPPVESAASQSARTAAANGAAGQSAKNGKPSHQVAGESRSHASVSASAPPARGAGNGASASMAECRAAETTVG
jgi:DNA-binding transcriptional LysR family regulator